MSWPKPSFLFWLKPMRHNNSFHPTSPPLRYGAAGEAGRYAYQRGIPDEVV